MHPAVDVLLLQVANAIFMMPQGTHDSNPVVQAMLQGLSWCEKHRPPDLASRNAYLSSQEKVSLSSLCTFVSSRFQLYVTLIEWYHLSAFPCQAETEPSPNVLSVLSLAQAIAEPMFCFETAFKLLTLSRASYAGDATPAGWETECALQNTLQSPPDQPAMIDEAGKDGSCECYCGLPTSKEVCTAKKRLQQ